MKLGIGSRLVRLPATLAATSTKTVVAAVCLVGVTTAATAGIVVIGSNAVSPHAQHDAAGAGLGSAGAGGTAVVVVPGGSASPKPSTSVTPDGAASPTPSTSPAPDTTPSALLPLPPFVATGSAGGQTAGGGAVIVGVDNPGPTTQPSPSPQAIAPSGNPTPTTSSAGSGNPSSSPNATPEPASSVTTRSVLSALVSSASFGERATTDNKSRADSHGKSSKNKPGKGNSKPKKPKKESKRGGNEAKLNAA